GWSSSRRACPGRLFPSHLPHGEVIGTAPAATPRVTTSLHVCLPYGSIVHTGGTPPTDEGDHGRHPRPRRRVPARGVLRALGRRAPPAADAHPGRGDHRVRPGRAGDVRAASARLTETACDCLRRDPNLRPRRGVIRGDTGFTPVRRPRPRQT